jgi:erythromycin esterase
MRNKWVILFLSALLVGAGLRAQDGAAILKGYATAVRSIDPADTDFADLAGLRRAIGDARIVLLGEQTHGEGSTFQAKTRLVKFLHEQMGFEVLAFESGLYDCARIWENVEAGGEVSKEVVGSLFYMYATSVQTQDLFRYVQGQLHGGSPLILAGFESQHTGAKAKELLFADFGRFLRQRYPAAIDGDWAAFRSISLSTFASRNYRPTEEERTRFFSKLSSLKQLVASDGLVRDSLTSSPGFWYRVLASIESQTTRYWQMVKGNEVSVRDLQMAQNLIWLAEKAYPGKKIIVWAHNGHIAKSISGLTVSFQPPTRGPEAFVPMGVTIHDYFGDRAYCIGFSGAGGTYMNYVDGQILSVEPKPAGSIEGMLSATGYAYAFVDYRRAPRLLKQAQQATMSDYVDATGIWPNTFDGLFFIKKIWPVERTVK